MLEAMYHKFNKEKTQISYVNNLYVPLGYVRKLPTLWVLGLHVTMGRAIEHGGCYLLAVPGYRNNNPLITDDNDESSESNKEDNNVRPHNKESCACSYSCELADSRPKRTNWVQGLTPWVP